MEQIKEGKDLMKYLIEFIINGESCKTLWGADINDNENDKFLIDSKYDIVIFKSFTRLREYVLSNIVFDSKNSIEWANQNKIEMEPFYSIDLDEIDEIITYSKEGIFQRDNANNLVDFINLFGDYAFQIENNILLSLFKNTSIQFVLDFNYDTEFWDSEKSWIDKLNKDLEKFDINAFKINLSRIKNELIGRFKLHS